jgi:glycosyltransferase involved in cell wall biosynthesis
MAGKESIDYSIVICTYNPDEQVLKRCLNAVIHLNTANITTEVILVDNNSKERLQELSYVKQYTAKIPGIRHLLVLKQGLTYARMSAIEQANGKHIVFFDDDNEAESEYLQELHKLNTQFPNVAAWGPGNVEVDFVDGVEDNIRKTALWLFQYRTATTIGFASIKEYQPCYPFGTGLCIKTDLCREYMSLVNQGRLTLTGRNGTKLTSGEDTQMVMLCISKGYAAGVSPALRITHIITAKRANRPYLNRLLHGTLVCYETCLLQIFPERREKLEQNIISSAKFSRQTLKKFLTARWKKDPQPTFDLIQFISLHAGVYTALDKPLPAIVNKVMKHLKVG